MRPAAILTLLLYTATLTPAQPLKIDPQAEIAAALYAASATQAAFQRSADAKFRAQRTEIEHLRVRVSAGEVRHQAELTKAQESYVAALSARDRAYAEEIAVFRSAVQDIAATPEGADALARFNAGDEPGALAILDDLRRARDAARQKRANIESAAEGRRIARLALEARARGKQTTAQVLTRFEEVTKLDPGVFWVWVELGRLYQSSGDLSKAQHAAEESARTAASDRDRSVALNELGSVLVAQGNGPGALAAYRKDLAIGEALVARDPANTERQHDLSVTYSRIGDVLVDQGDGPEALTAYRKALALTESLATRDPANTGWQRDLSVSHEKIGDVLAAQGDRPGALTAYRKALALREGLAAREPANTMWQRDLSISHERIGDVLLAQRDGPGALAAYNKASAIREALAARDPANTEWQRDLAISHEKLGNILVAQGDRPGALTAYRKALAISEALAARDPANTRWQRDLSVSTEAMGDVLFDQGDRPGALTAYRKSLAIREALATRDPANTEWQRDLIVGYVKLSIATGDKTFARKALDIALSLQQRGKLTPREAPMIPGLQKLLAP